MHENDEFVRIIGGENGPTSIFLTVKINHKYLIFPFGFLAIFIFNFLYLLPEFCTQTPINERATQ
jgi:Na+-transporting methylmalonyl-CoA/oxaloacetate decarboxylase beta subunit